LEDISLHILDIAENSVRADAKKISIVVAKDSANDILSIEVIDDGKGMDAETLIQVRDPFFSTKKKKTGLGIPLLTQAAEQTGGKLTVESTPGKGTRIAVTFCWSHLDRPPMGSLTDTILTLIAGHPELEYIYEEREGSHAFQFDIREIKKELEGIPVTDPAVLNAIRDLLKQNIRIKE
jgi:hypothetical protein